MSGRKKQSRKEKEKNIAMRLGLMRIRSALDKGDLDEAREASNMVFLYISFEENRKFIDKDFLAKFKNLQIELSKYSTESSDLIKFIREIDQDNIIINNMENEEEKTIYINDKFNELVNFCQTQIGAEFCYEIKLKFGFNYFYYLTDVFKDYLLNYTKRNLEGGLLNQGTIDYIMSIRGEEISAYMSGLVEPTHEQMLEEIKNAELAEIQEQELRAQNKKRSKDRSKSNYKAKQKRAKVNYKHISEKIHNTIFSELFLDKMFRTDILYSSFLETFINTFFYEVLFGNIFLEIVNDNLNFKQYDDNITFTGERSLFNVHITLSETNENYEMAVIFSLRSEDIIISYHIKYNKSTQDFEGTIYKSMYNEEIDIDISNELNSFQ